MDDQLRKATGLFGVFFLALVAPIILLPIEKALPYSFVFEEGYKLLLVVMIGRLAEGSLVKPAAGMGLAFAVSETMLYVGGIFGFGPEGLFFQKIMVTLAVHPGTGALYGLAVRRGKAAIMASLAAGMVFHWLVNRGGS